MAQRKAVAEITPEKVLNAILEQAVQDRASDVHIEPMVDQMRVRFRIDGFLQERLTRPLHELEPIVTRIKAISNLDIATHLPQDGHFEFTLELKDKSGQLPASAGLPAQAGQPVQEAPSRLADALSSFFGEGEKPPVQNQDLPVSMPAVQPALQRAPGTYLLNVRVSAYPTVYGEVVVLRLLNRSEMLMPLDAIGMEPEDLLAVRNLITRSYGMVLMTGPAGSGKTTTLYAILQELKNKEKNIVTLEDPVEFYFGDIRQTQIKPEQGFTFAVGMKAILRQDPDVIMVGEVRDAETAEYAMRASLVGRMVASTVHSNTAVGTIARLIDMNVERSLIAYAVNGIIAQRLVRVVCNGCKVTYKPEQSLLAYLGLDANQQYIKGQGCSACGGTGYQGRTGVYNVLEFDDKLRALIVEKASMLDLQTYMDSKGVKTLKQRAVDKILAGITTVEEVARAV